MQVDGGVRIAVHAQPGAKRTEIVGLHGDYLKIRVQAPPVDGRANEELIRFLAKTLGVPTTQVSLTRGSAGRAKSFLTTGVDLAQVQQALLG